MGNRREDDARHQYDRQTAVEGIETRKELAAVRQRPIDRSHATQEHGRVVEGINPLEALEVVIPQHAGQQGNRNEYGRDRPAACQPDQELMRSNDRLRAMLQRR